MRRRSNIRDDCLAIELEGALHARCGGARGGEQGFDKAPRVFRAQANDFAPGDELFGGFAGVGDNEGGHRAPLERGGLLEDMFIGARDPRDEPLRFLGCCFDRHGGNVCRGGTHCKW